MTLLVWVNTGDSIAGAAGRWPYQYLGLASKSDTADIKTMNQAVYVKTGLLFCNMAVSGTVLGSAGTGASSDVANIVTTYVDSVVARKSIPGLTARKYLFTCAIGTNDGCLGGLGSVAAYASAVASMAQARRTAGYDLIGLCTILPRTDAAGPMIDSNRVAYNTLLTDSSWRSSNGIDYVIDLAGETTMGNIANTTNATYYNSDNIHPTDTGSALLATNQVTPVINTILASI
jgi:lysophospholipase L1-like esterase